MKIRVSEYIADYLVSRGIHRNFTVPGGGAMYLNVAFGHQKGMENYFMQHEQAAAIAAEACYRVNNELPLVCCTTGPGGTNTLTGVLGAWLDSIPMLVISGQVKYALTVRSTGLPFRIYGDQEFDITNVVQGMTKYAVMVTKPEMIRYHLDKALFLCLHGRKGPVWLDIPLDVQNALIDTDDLVLFDEREMDNTLCRPVSESIIELLVQKIRNAKRPVIYSGVEIRTNGSYDIFRQVIEKLNIPVVTSFDGIDILEDEHPLYAGRAGDVGNRYGNWAVQNSDFILVLGSRLGLRQVGFTPETWARKAFVAMVYEDPVELTKNRVHVELPIRAELTEFLLTLDKGLKGENFDFSEWFSIIRKWREEYPVVDQERHYKGSENTNPYCLINELGKKLQESEVVVSGNGSACVVGAAALEIKKNQRFIINSGCASMGYDLPAAIGASFALDKRSVICLAGDGSIQMNLQELQTMVFHKLPIKILVLNNAGYHSMRLTQNNLFPEYSKVGVGPESGDLSFPNMERIASAYEIPYFAVNNNSDVENVLTDFLSKEGYAICEVFIDTSQAFEPKPSARKLPDGTIVSPPMEDMAPFLDREKLKEIMIIPLLDEEEN